MVDVRGVGPYFLQQTLGKGQTGNYHVMYSFFQDFFFYNFRGTIVGRVIVELQI